MSPIKPVLPPHATASSLPPSPLPAGSVPAATPALSADGGAAPATVGQEELLQMHDKFRALKHSACNALAVIMALSEMAERNPTYVEKLTKTVLQKSPQIVTELRTFDDELRALLKAQPE